MHFDDCPCSGKNLTKLLKPMLLVLLAGGEQHGYALKTALDKTGLFAGNGPDISGIYYSLKEMETRGVVDSEWAHSRSGPAKHTFRLTAKGRKCLDEWGRSLSEYRTQLDGVVKLINEAVQGPPDMHKG